MLCCYNIEAYIFIALGHEEAVATSLKPEIIINKIKK